jgi:hypothetical protein
MFDPTDDQFFMPSPQNTGRGPRPILRFYIEPVEQTALSAQEGRPVYKDVDMVGITNPGSRDEHVVNAEKKAKTDEYIAWAYKKWKATQEQVVDGTPVETVPFLGKAVVLELKAINIHTLEQLALAPEPALQRMMGLRDLKKKAEAYMAAAKDSAVVTKMQHELSQRDHEIAALKASMAQMSARFDEMQKEQANG